VARALGGNIRGVTILYSIYQMLLFHGGKVARRRVGMRGNTSTTAF
jgi:hypothetical protein